VREEIVFGHVPGVAPGLGGKAIAPHQPGEAGRDPFAVHIVMNLLFDGAERLG